MLGIKKEHVERLVFEDNVLIIQHNIILLKRISVDADHSLYGEMDYSSVKAAGSCTMQV